MAADHQRVVAAFRAGSNVRIGNSGEKHEWQLSSESACVEAAGTCGLEGGCLGQPASKGGEQQQCCECSALFSSSLELWGALGTAQWVLDQALCGSDGELPGVLC